MPHAPFVPLRIFSSYTMLDGAIDPKAIAKTAAELNLPEGVLASRRLLEGLQDGSGWNGALAGWRRHILEPSLAPLLNN